MKGLSQIYRKFVNKRATRSRKSNYLVLGGGV